MLDTKHCIEISKPSQQSQHYLRYTTQEAGMDIFCFCLGWTDLLTSLCELTGFNLCGWISKGVFKYQAVDFFNQNDKAKHVRAEV